MRLKAVMLLTLPVAVTAGYLAIQRAVVFPDGRVPVTWFDHVIPFQPRWVWVYLSMYLLNPIGPLFTRSREDLLRYTRGVVCLFVCGFLCFVFFPVPGPRPPAADDFWLYQRLILVDRPYNSFPSLHAACAVYAVLFAAYASCDTSRPHLRMSLVSLAWLWVGLILYSTIAIRQHFAIDLPAGMFLGLLAQWLFVSRTPRPSNLPALVDREAA
jgi:membrane-associated phospholipid phosphatase